MKRIKNLCYYQDIYNQNYNVQKNFINKQDVTSEELLQEASMGISNNSSGKLS